MPATPWDRVLKAVLFLCAVGLVIYDRVTIVDLQSEIAELKASGQTEQQRYRAELAATRAEKKDMEQLLLANRELPKLRNELHQSRSTGEELQRVQKENQQLRSLIAQFQQTEAPPQPAPPPVQLASVIAAPAEPDARASAARCINNLRIFEGAKDQWALETKKETGASPVVNEVKDYLRGGLFPTCPAGGTYTLNAIGSHATCSIVGHSLPVEVPAQ